MRILINDGMSADGIQMLRDAGHEVVTDKIAQADLPAKLGGFDAIVVRSATKVRQPDIDGGLPRLKAIVRGGVGVDNIDKAYAESKGVKVMNTPAASSPSVAELALAHMFALTRFIVPANLTMRQGQWNKKAYEGVELGGKTLGILGIGRIGHSLAEKALGLGMKVIAFDPFVSSIDLPVELVSKDDALTHADFISMHMPAQKDGFVIGEAELAKMKKGSYLINCARGGVVDEAALIAALDSGHLAGAGVDVFIGEPEVNKTLVNHAKVSVTPHIGAATIEAQYRIGAEVAKKLMELFK